MEHNYVIANAALQKMKNRIGKSLDGFAGDLQNILLDVYESAKSEPSGTAAISQQNGELIRKAVQIIKAWHGMGHLPERRKELWDTYWKRAQEMRPFREYFKGTQTEPF